MSHTKSGGIAFAGALAFALGLYAASAPTGLPWLRSALAAALAGGLVGVLANRCFGWRIGVAAALAWVTLPGVWDRAVTGSVGVCWASGAVLALGLAQALFLFLTRRARHVRRSPSFADADRSSHGAARRRSRGGRIVSWSLLGAAAVFAICSVTTHDYRLGKAAGAYARATLDEAGDRFVILNGVADDRMVREEARRNREAGRAEADSRLLQFRPDDAYRVQLVARVRRLWPEETNLWTAAQIGPTAFADAVFKSHPDRVYAMTGQSTTPEKWAKRWTAMTPYLGSRDRFVPHMRRAFAVEGNSLANRLQDAGKLKEAWELYRRIYAEIDPGNASALVNLDGMLRRGYTTEHSLRQRIACGMKALAQGTQASKPPSAMRTLAEWNNEMIRAHGRGDVATAARIARKILSNPDWRAFIPANAVMGSVLAHEGDCAAAEPFFKAALNGKGSAAPQPVVMNDYADALRRLGRYDEAEALVRRAIAASGGKARLFKRTLAQIQRDAARAKRTPPAYRCSKSPS